MKKLMQFFIGIVLLQLNSFAQQSQLEKRLTVHYNKISLQQVLIDLQNRYSFQFSYSNSEVPLQSKVTIKATNQTASFVFDQLFKPLHINYILVGNKIVLKAVNNRTRKDDLSKKIADHNLLFQTIKGNVIDKDTKQPLSGATIIIRATSPIKAAITDSNGFFKVNQVGIGRQEVEVTMMGYQKITITDLLVGSGKELVLNVEMLGEAGLLEQVTVKHHRDRQKASNEMATVSARSFTVEETNRYAASISDPARMALSFAGVSATDDLSNELVIRGNSPKGMLWKLEGIEINNPNHFTDEGSSGGGVSMISANMLDNSDFYTGAFPAEYGNALSGVFDLKFRKGNAEKQEYSFYAGLLGVGASAEGPFSKNGKSSYLVNYRYSTLGLLKKVGLNPISNGAVPEYQDLAFHLNFPTKSAGSFSLFGIGGISNQRKFANKDSKDWENFWDKIDTDFEYFTGSAGLKHELPVSRSSYIRSILSYSGSLVNEDMDTLDNSFNPQLFGRDRYANQAIRASTLLNTKLNNKNLLRTGIVYSHLLFDYSSLATRRSQGIQINYLKDKGHTSLLQTYLQWRYRLARSLSFNTGAHVSWFALSNDVSIEPRIGAEWNLNSKQSFTLGAGMHSRVEPLILYFAKTTLPDGTKASNNKDLDLTKATHFVFGYNRRLNNHLKFKAEAYYQYIYDAPVVS
ncbi:MAG TPA: carboxypeptidase-like regulatory domain-containing protein, partial [Flavisolibacter sp.]|nr:carboxypeptidase-like regulatory domain-containing protein [Flavisolibacter sp.]